MEAVGREGAFPRMVEGLAAASAMPKTIIIYLKARRTASSLRLKKGVFDASSVVPKGA